MTPIFELCDQTRALYDSLDEGGELTTDQCLALDLLDKQRDAIYLELCKILMNLKIEAEILDAAYRPIRIRAYQKEDAIKSVKAAMLSLMGTFGDTKIRVGPFQISLRNNSSPVCSVDPSVLDTTNLSPVKALNPMFVRSRDELALSEIAKAYAAGLPIPDGCTVSTGKHVAVSYR